MRFAPQGVRCPLSPYGQRHMEKFNRSHYGSHENTAVGPNAKPEEADSDPHRLAEICRDEIGNLRYWLGSWYAYSKTAYRKLSKDEAEAEVVRIIKAEFDRAYSAATEQANPHKTGRPRAVRKVTRTIVSNVMIALKSLCVLADDVDCPSWLGEDEPPVATNEILADRSTWIHLPTRRQLEPTPAFFNTGALDFDYDPGSEQPHGWFGFLRDLFEFDSQPKRLLQEWFGYCLTPDTSLQKAFLIMGPPRSGKGVIARVLTRLIGQENVCTTTASSLAARTGLQPLIGKTLAIVSQHLFTKRNSAAFAERLLSIVKEELIPIRRKGHDFVNMKLPTRFMFLSNELPQFNDPRASLEDRFVILNTTQSFLGREAPSLASNLMRELPGILNWAIDGRRRLMINRGQFGNDLMP